MPRVAELWLDRVCFAVAVILKFQALDAEKLVIIFLAGCGTASEAENPTKKSGSGKRVLVH
jgi:hypothetical protein